MSEIPNTVFGLMALMITALVGVVLYQNKKIEFLYKEKNDLQEQRRLDMVGVNDKQNEVLGNFSQTANLLLAKLSGENK